MRTVDLGMEKSIAVIGAGNWGRNLVKTLAHLGVLTHVAEPSESIRSRISAEYPGVDLRNGYESLLNEAGINAVAIATPAPTHHAIAKAFLEAGKDVFVEKPITLDVAEAEDLAATAEARDRILMAGHLLMYQPAIARVKEMIDGGVIGRLFTIHQERLKLGRARAVEDVLWSFGVHDVAVLLHLAGAAPVRSSAVKHRGLQPEVADDVYLHLEFASGTTAHLHNAWLWPENRRRLTAIGSEGMIVYDEVAQTVVLHRKRIDPDSLANVDEGEEVVFEGAAQPLEIELRHFLDCVETRRAPRSCGRSAVEVVRVLEQASAF